jgi:hypothetical protein
MLQGSTTYNLHTYLFLIQIVELNYFERVASKITLRVKVCAIESVA